MAKTTRIILLLTLTRCQPPPTGRPAPTSATGTTNAPITTGTTTGTTSTTGSTAPWTGDPDWRAPAGWSWTGASGDHLGHFLAVGDVDGDGLADVVASFGEDYGLGVGSHGARWIAGTSAAGAAANADGGVWSLANINSVSDGYGQHLSVASNFTGEGVADVVVGEISYGQQDEPWILDYQAPARGAQDPLVATAFLPLSEASRTFQSDTRFLGDLDGDGTPELLAGGAVYFGPRLGPMEAGAGDLVFTGPAPFIDGVVIGDFDTDGLDDIAGSVLEPYPEPARLAAFEGLTPGVRDIEAPDLVWADGDSQTLGGTPFRRGEDPVGDGRAYLSLMDYTLSNALLLGPEPYADDGAWASFAPRYADDQCGPTAFGDFDGDGQRDWLIGIQRGSEAPPRVALVAGPIAVGGYGEDDALSVTLLVDGPPGGPDLASYIDVGDLDGDGTDDAVIGDPSNAAGGEAAGAILVLPGAALR